MRQRGEDCAELLGGSKLEKQEFIKLWKSIPEANEIFSNLEGGRSADLESAKSALQGHNVSYIARRTVGDQEVVYFSCAWVGHERVVLLLEITFKPGAAAKLCVKSSSTQASQQCQAALQGLLSG